MEIAICTGENFNPTGFATQTQSKREVSTWQVRVSCYPDKTSSASTDGRHGCLSSHQKRNASVYVPSSNFDYLLQILENNEETNCISPLKIQRASNLQLLQVEVCCIESEHLTVSCSLQLLQVEVGCIESEHLTVSCSLQLLQVEVGCIENDHLTVSCSLKLLQVEVGCIESEHLTVHLHIYDLTYIIYMTLYAQLIPTQTPTKYCRYLLIKCKF